MLASINAEIADAMAEKKPRKRRPPRKPDVPEPTPEQLADLEKRMRKAGIGS